jgi:hypothetical protein
MPCNASVGHVIIQCELSFEIAVRRSRFQILCSKSPAVVMFRYFLRRDSVVFGIEECWSMEFASAGASLAHSLS